LSTADPITRVQVRFGSVEQLVQEYASRLSKGIVVASCTDPVRVGDRCDVTLVHPATGHMLPLRVRVTSTNMAQRIVCQFEEFSPQIDAAIRDFVNLAPDRAAEHELPPQTDEDIRAEGSMDLVVEGNDGTLWEDESGSAALSGIDVSELGDDVAPGTTDGELEGLDGDNALSDVDTSPTGDEAPNDDASLLRTGMAYNVHERLRHLKTHEIFKIA